MDKKERERIGKLLNTHVNPPTDSEIEQTISIIENRMVGKDENTPAFKGYLSAIDILSHKRTEIPDIGKLDTIQARAIASIAIDYLKGDCTRQILTNIPLPEKKK